MSVYIKRHISQWGFFSFEDGFSHGSVDVPQGCYNWQDDLSHSLQGCLETVCKTFNSFSDRAWQDIEKCQELGIEEMEPYESQVNELQKFRL